ncbi:hypothetical protein AB0L20_32265 [Streptomyces albidoflavus]|uniref:hypothetical protein n=1 Tax=Streptomyces albidoflavus TaxID=1886 RepID=UPI003443A4B3
MSKRPGFVPHRKLHKALEKLKAKDAEFTRLREEHIRLEERTNQILQRMQSPPQPQAPVEEPPPRPEDDIFGAVAHQAKTLDELRRDADQRKKVDEERARVGAVFDAANRKIAEFQATAPDYSAAYSHLLHSRKEELQMLGYTHDQIEQTLFNDELGIAARALQANKNPGEVIYNLAKQRGYAVKAAAPAATPAEQIAKTADVQARSMTLSSGGGSPVPVTLDARTVARMSEKEFAALMAKNPEALEKLMMG